MTDGNEGHLGLNEGEIDRLATLFSALGDPTRLRVVSALRHGEHHVGELCDELELSPSTMSHQLAVLRKLGLVRRQREGRRIYYALDDEHVEQILSYGIEHILHQAAPQGHATRRPIIAHGVV